MIMMMMTMTMTMTVRRNPFMKRKYWDFPVYAESMKVSQLYRYVRITNVHSRKVILLEMNCPWVENRDEAVKKAQNVAARIKETSFRSIYVGHSCWIFLKCLSLSFFLLRKCHGARQTAVTSRN